MNKYTQIKLQCVSVRYHSMLDEDAFFEWIEKIKAITRVEGIGRELYLYLEDTHIADDDLRELLALFYRYKIDMKQLKIFLNEDNKEWFFGRPKGYWHRKVFGASKAT